MIQPSLAEQIPRDPCQLRPRNSGQQGLGEPHATRPDHQTAVSGAIRTADLSCCTGALVKKSLPTAQMPRSVAQAEHGVVGRSRRRTLEPGAGRPPPGCRPARSRRRRTPPLRSCPNSYAMASGSRRSESVVSIVSDSGFSNSCPADRAMWLVTARSWCAQGVDCWSCRGRQGRGRVEFPGGAG